MNTVTHREEQAVHKASRDEESARSVRRVKVVDQESLEVDDRVPDDLAVDDLGGRSDEHADDLDDKVGQGEADQLAWSRVRGSGEKVRKYETEKVVKSTHPGSGRSAWLHCVASHSRLRLSVGARSDNPRIGLI